MIKKEKNMYKKLGYLAKVHCTVGKQCKKNRQTEVKLQTVFPPCILKIFSRHFSFKFKKFESILSVLCNQNFRVC